MFQFVLDKDRNKITLGEGSFGFVMLIRHIESQELYALKLVSKKKAKKWSFLWKKPLNLN